MQEKQRWRRKKVLREERYEIVDENKRKVVLFNYRIFNLMFRSQYTKSIDVTIHCYLFSKNDDAYNIDLDCVRQKRIN